MHQRVALCWKVQLHPEKDANNTQRGMKVLLKSWCDFGVLIKGRKTTNKPQLPIAQAAKQEKAAGGGCWFNCYFNAVTPCSQMRVWH